MTTATIEATMPRRGRGVRVLLLALIGLLALALLGIAYVLYSVQHTPEHTPVVANQPGVQVAFESFGGAFGRLQHPAGVAFDRSRNRIYVTEPETGQIIVFDGNGKNGRVFVSDAKKGAADTRAAGQYTVLTPTGIDVDSAGNVYVADPQKAAVLVFDPTGKKVREIRAMMPASVTVAGNRLYMITDRTVYVTDLKGNRLGQWGTWGRAQNQLADPGAVAVDSAKNIYITDRDNYRVLSLTPALAFRWEFGHTATTEEAANARALGGPSGLTIGGDGNIYALDGLNSDIVVMDKSGKSVSIPLSGPGSADDQLYLPKAIKWMSGNLFVIADTFHNRIVGFQINPQKQ